MRRRYLALALALAIAVPLAAAQEKQQPPPDKGAASQQRAGKPAGKSTRPGQAMKPVPEMQKLKFLVGRWTTTEKFEANEFVPKSGTGTGKAQIHSGPGGLSLIENYDSKNDVIGPFAGHAVLWWDAKAGVYKSFWCDSMQACDSSLGAGKWDGDKLVFTTDSEYQGKKISMRSTFSEIKPDSFTWAEELSTDGGPMKPSMSIQYTRVSGAKPPAGTTPKM